MSSYNFAFLDEQTKRMIRRAILKAVAIPGYQVPFGSREMPLSYGWGTGGVQVTASVIGPDDVLKVIDQGADDTTNAVSIRRFFERTTGVRTTTRTDAATMIQTRHRIPETPLREGQIVVFQVPIPEPLRWLEPRETETRKMHALEEYGVMHVRLYEDITRHGHVETAYDYPVLVNGRYIMRPSPIPKFDNPSSIAIRPFCSSAPAARSASTRCRRSPRSGASISRITRSRSSAGTRPARSAGRPTYSWTRSSWTTRADACSSARTPTTASAGVAADGPLLRARGVTRYYGARVGCLDVGFDLWPGEVLGIVGESGSGKTTLLGCLSGRLEPTGGTVEFAQRDGTIVDVLRMAEPALRKLARTDWGIVHQNPRDGLRLGVTAGANVGERLMALGARHYGKIRGEALEWLGRVEIDRERIDDCPDTFSSGMQQRLQIARNLVTRPRLVFMDEPTGGLDVSVQARLLDLVRGLVADLGLSAVIVTHDLAVTRLLAHRLLVMRGGQVVESGLTDQVLDDPQHPYTQLLVSSVLQP